MEDGEGEGVVDVDGIEGGGRQECPGLGRRPSNRMRQFNVMTVLGNDVLESPH